MKSNFSLPSTYGALILIWIIANLFQAGFTELDPDEAYYWVYSQQLDWGYYDHPSAIAFLIKIGSFLLPGSLGVRLLPVLLMGLSFYFIWMLLEKPNKKEEQVLLFLLLAAIPMLEVYGFIATPDSPVLFFGTLFLLLYKGFLKEANWLNTILLGICMAALLHSKYQGVFWIFFVLLSNWRLLLNFKFYVACFLGFILFFPHLYWQYSNDFPSFRYHLTGRNDPYELKFTLNYLLNQFLIFSPFLFPFILAALFKYKAKNQFEKSWFYLIWGFWLSFLVLTFKGHAEPQWTALIAIPIAMILFKAVQKNSLSSKWVKGMAITTITLLFVVRIFLVIPFKNMNSDFHKTDWIPQLKEMAGGLPILFIDSYRDPSKYAFYSGERAYTQTDMYYRKNQFDIWDWEKVLHNQKVFIVGQGNLKCSTCKPLKLINRGGKTYTIADSFQVSQNVWIDYTLASDTLGHNSTHHIQLSVFNPYEHEIVLNKGNFPLQLHLILVDEADKIHWYPIKNDVPVWKPGENKLETGTFIIPEYSPVSGNCRLFVGIKTGELFPCRQSNMEEIWVK